MEALNARKEKQKQMTVRARRSTGNVFKDLGFSDDEAENLKIRADLMIELTKLIEAQELTQTAAAELLGVTQPRVSDLMRGKIDRFSVDTLMRCSVMQAPASPLWSLSAARLHKRRRPRPIDAGRRN
jgi:predicted XRE-type DNA-binding protein